MAIGADGLGHHGPRGRIVGGGRVALVNWNGYRQMEQLLRRLTGYEPHLDWCRTRQGIGYARNRRKDAACKASSGHVIA